MAPAAAAADGAAAAFGLALATAAAAAAIGAAAAFALALATAAAAASLFDNLKRVKHFFYEPRGRGIDLRLG